MNDEERALIKAFVENKPMFEAVRRVLLGGMIGRDFTRTNWVWGIDERQSDAAFGKQVKISKKAIDWINSGFRELQQLGQSNPQVEVVNQSR